MLGSIKSNESKEISFPSSVYFIIIV